MHLVSLLDEDVARCGVRLRPVGSVDPDWTDIRAEADCPACIEDHDEAAYDRELERQSFYAGVGR